jgi:hypothetical protein
VKSQTLTPPTTGTSLYDLSFVTASTCQPFRHPAGLLPKYVLFCKGDTFHVTCSGSERTDLLYLAFAFRKPNFLRHQQYEIPVVFPRFCGSVHESTTKTPCSASSEESGIFQWYCPHSQHHLTGHLAETMVSWVRAEPGFRSALKPRRMRPSSGCRVCSGVVSSELRTFTNL